MGSNKKYKCLDLFCGAGGAGHGYFLAGFDVVGVDNTKQPKHPDHMQFMLKDAIEVLSDIEFCQKFHLIHASPVCKRYSVMSVVTKKKNSYPDQIKEVREKLRKIGVPYVIENVPGSPLENYVELCGTMFGLNVIRHRWFECNPIIIFPPYSCNHIKKVVKHGRKPDRNKHYAAVTGHFSDIEFAKKSMGIDWMGQKELALAIPPAYTKWIGEQMLKFINNN